MTLPVITRSYTNARDGAYVSRDLKLTSSYVQKNGVSVLGRYKLDDPRGTEGMVLIAPNVRIRNGVRRDLALIGDMSGNIYGFNRQAPYNLIWKNTVASPMVVTTQQDMWGINPAWSIVSTGVLDLDAGIWHIVALSTPDGTAANAAYFFHSITIADGSPAYPPLALNGATFTAPSGSVKRFGAALRKQRAALTQVGKTVYVPFGSFAETAGSNLGWNLAIDVSAAPKIVDTWATGDRHLGAGIWQGGAGLSVTDNGDLLCMTGNGGFAPLGDWGECFMRLSPNLVPKQWWSPYSDAGRAGLDPTLPTELGMMEGMDMGQPPPNNAMAAMDMASMGDIANVVPSNVHKVGDQDLGSGGPLYLPKSLTGFDRDFLLGGGKDGILWILDADKMGNTMPDDFRPSKIAGNYRHLVYPAWGWTFNGMGMNLQPTNLDELPIAVGGYTRHIHGQPVAYISPDHGLLTFVHGENGPVRAVSISSKGVPAYVACGTQVASAGMKPPGGMPGGMLGLAVTEQRANTAVLWSAMPWYGDANRTITPGRFVGLAANWVENGNLITVWDSAQWGVNYSHNKFCPPTMCDDCIFLPTYDGEVLILG